MIVNRYILIKMGIKDNYTINRIMQLASNPAPFKDKINVCSEMVKNDRSCLVATPHFDITKWIQMQKERILIVPDRYKDINKALLDIVISAYEKYKKGENR